MNQWKENIGILESVRTHLNDKLDSVNDGLRLQKGDHPNRGTSIITKPWDVHRNIQALINHTGNQYFNFLQQSANDSPEFFEKVADFHRECKVLTHCLNQFKDNFQRHSHDEKYAGVYERLFDQAFAFTNQVKEYKTHLKKPPLKTRPLRHIDYDERSNPLLLKPYYPKRVPLIETVQAAKKAFFFAQQQHLSSNAALAISLIPSTAKALFWNPFEYIARGEVRTKSSYTSKGDSNTTHHVHMNAYEGFAKQVLYCPLISEEVAEAFEQLAPHAKCLHLGLKKYTLIAEDLAEFKFFIEDDKRAEAMTVADYLDIAKVMLKEQIKRTFPLSAVEAAYTSFNDSYLMTNDKTIAFEDSHLLRHCKNSLSRPHKTTPFITVKALQRLLQSGYDSPTCQKIEISTSFEKCPYVQDFLLKHSYQLQKVQPPKGLEKKIYLKSQKSLKALLHT